MSISYYKNSKPIQLSEYKLSDIDSPQRILPSKFILYIPFPSRNDKMYCTNVKGNNITLEKLIHHLSKLYEECSSNFNYDYDQVILHDLQYDEEKNVLVPMTSLE